MIVIVVVVGVVVLWWRVRAGKVRSAGLKADQAAQQVQSPYAALHARYPRSGLVGGLVEMFLRGKGF